MIKVLGALATAGLILAVGFVVLPKLLLKAPGTSVNQTNQSVLLGRSLPLAALTPSSRPSAVVTPNASRFEDFSSIEARAGFKPLTPSGLPGGYQPWERFLRASEPSEVVMVYRKPDDLYLLIVERKVDPATANPFQRPDNLPRLRSASATPFSRQPQSPRIDVAGTQGLYIQGANGAIARALNDALSDVRQRNPQPHAVIFDRGDIEITVEADQTDVTREQLIQTASGLR